MSSQFDWKKFDEEYFAYQQYQKQKSENNKNRSYYTGSGLHRPTKNTSKSDSNDESEIGGLIVFVITLIVLVGIFVVMFL